MKKIALLLLVLLTSIAAQATDLTGVKIYINPGHGGYDSNDRSIWTIPVPETWTNPNGYWESKSNLVKGLALKEMLEAAGATVIISRTDNSSGIRDGAQFAGGGDRDLSEIAEEANAGNVDHFLSIHSNALNSTTNYLLLLYHGYDNQPTVAASLPMVQNSGPIQFDNPLTVWSSSAINLRGDFTFYGDNLGLGVLRPLTVPGFLSEGSFHDYPPETHRLSNDDYCKLEALRFFKHFHTYYNRDMPVNGTVAGWIKSSNEPVNTLNQPKFTYRANSDDQWLPVNGATVKLLSADGSSELQTYTTDNWYNGIFAFYNVVPGNYKVKVEAQNYETKIVDVTLAASSIAYAKVQIKNVRLIVPDYPDPNQEAGVMALPNYDFQANGSIANPEWLQNNTIKRALYRNGKLYVLTTASGIIVADAQTTNFIKELDMTGAGNISDIAFTADNFLLACTKETIALENPATWWKVYTWDDDNSAPRLLFQTQNNGGWDGSEVGETFTVSGSRWNCKIYTTAISTSVTADASPRIAVMALEYDEDNPSQLEYKYLIAETAMSAKAWGEHPVLTLSPSGNGDHLYIDSETLLPVEYHFSWEKTSGTALIQKAAFAVPAGYTLEPVSSGGNFFRNAKHTYLALPVSEADGAKAGVVLFDVNDGLDKAVKVSAQYPAEGLGETPATYMTATGIVNGYDIELLVLAKNQGMAKYKTVDVPTA
ncbi:MAG: N-acetylmuramoyl-L-alanine amidase, partial [Candidatus Symbiothrix sp.]|nr:N-acetylmuramoyl-L-alanine amidase [Candidatus Symbiothrix sp.]